MSACCTFAVRHEQEGEAPFFKPCGMPAFGVCVSRDIAKTYCFFHLLEMCRIHGKQLEILPLAEKAS